MIPHLRNPSPPLSAVGLWGWSSDPVLCPLVARCPGSLLMRKPCQQDLF